MNECILIRNLSVSFFFFVSSQLCHCCWDLFLVFFLHVLCVSGLCHHCLPLMAFPCSFILVCLCSGPTDLNTGNSLLLIGEKSPYPTHAIRLYSGPLRRMLTQKDMGTQTATHSPIKQYRYRYRYLPAPSQEPQFHWQSGHSAASCEEHESLS